ncbi:MAG: epoxyqueuosine reductase QueH [Patescibacteria group bacterium]|nr:epoxyqueuosine reductase QueH [Patescibacteria group bacterium]
MVETSKQKLLIHICCATCAAYVLEQLRERFDVTAYYYNPNIYPESEYNIRRDEAHEYCKRNGFSWVEEAPDQTKWHQTVKGHEHDPERGNRCTICYRIRLEKTANYAQQHGFQCFGTDLTISPHKDAKRLNAIGKELEAEYSIKYLEADFKKADGFKKAIELSRKECFYRQHYCGCIYSFRSQGPRK